MTRVSYVVVTSLVTGLKSRGHQFDPGWRHSFCFFIFFFLRIALAPFDYIYLSQQYEVVILYGAIDQ